MDYSFSPKSVPNDCRRTRGRSTTDKDATAPVNAEIVRGTFRRFDTDRDGRLNKQELKNAFTSLGSRLPSLRAALAMHHADANGDGYIDQFEFEKLVDYVLKRGYKVQTRSN